MADITNVFKATVKASRSINKAIRGHNGHNHEQTKQQLLQPKQKTVFESKARNLVRGLTQLRDFLMKHRQDYINPTDQLSYMTSHMTDSERDIIDDESQAIIKKTQEAIRLLRDEVCQHKVQTQVHEHRAVVFELLDIYLKGICRLYSEQRAIRVKQVIDRKRLSRLEPERTIQRLTVDQLQSHTNPSGDSASQTKTNETDLSHLAAPPTDDDLSPDEVAMFEQENQVLYNEMNSMMSEVRQIEGKVVEISRLQEIFSEKVLEQEKEIETIAETAAATTDNIKDANEEIREAMKNNASFRVWILFILVVCSFSLLFLDWYND